MSSALQQYQRIKISAPVEGASPHRLIQMLFEGALEQLSSAKGHLQRGAIAPKGEQIGKAISIIGGLRDGLNVEAGGELANKLDALYDYMQRRLLLANLNSDPAILDEVANLLREVKAGWDGIGG
jgi:flagellar protein FliS